MTTKESTSVRTEKTSTKLATILLPLISFIAVAVFQTLRLAPALPTLLQDEYIYSVGTKYGGMDEAARFGNFLYFEMYQYTQLCGPEFYTCARSINGFWYVVMLYALFVFARRYFSAGISTLIVAGIGLGPMGIFSSLFMPEIMYFSLVTLGIVFFVETVEPVYKWPKMLALVLSFTFIGLGSMVKPHAAFLALGLILFIAVQGLAGRFGPAKSLVTLGTAITSFLVTKFLIGWILAGPAGITLFGRSYTNALLDFFSDFGGGEELGQSQDGRIQVIEDNSSSILGALDVVAIHFLVTLMALIILGGPLLAVLVLRKDILKLQVPMVILSQLVFIGAIVSVFAAHLTVNGDDHSDRLLFRYFEFLLPFLLILGVHFSPNAALTGWRKYGAMLLTVLALVLSFTGLQNREWLIADSVNLFSVFRPEDGAWAWSVVSLVIAYLLFVPQNWSRIGAAVAISVGIASIGQIGISQQLKTNGFMVSSDFAGKHVYENYPEVPGEEILVLGSDRKLVEAAMFLIDKPEIDFKLFESGTEIDSDTIPGEYSIVVQTTGVFLNDGFEDNYYGDGFTISFRELGTAEQPATNSGK